MPSMKQIQITGNRTLVARIWPGEGVPVVLLHGLFRSSEAWSEIAPALGRPVVAFDLPGFGGSDLPRSPDVSSYAQDLGEGIRSLGIERFELVGHSFGGAIAACLAELMAERVTELVLLAPAGFGRIPVAEAVAAPGLRMLADAAMPWILKRRGTVAEAPKELMAAARTANRALVGAGRASRRPGGYRGPVTAVWGTDDHTVRPGHSRGVLAAFPQADLVFWGGARHALVRECAGAVAELVRTGRTPRLARHSRHPRLSLRFLPDGFRVPVKGPAPM